MSAHRPPNIGPIGTTGNTRTVALIGQPVSHSLSPALHSYWLREHGIDGAYLPLELSAYEFAAEFPQLRKFGLLGCNVTIPHKEAVMLLADRIDATAEAIGAANTVCFSDGEIHVTNTDAYGFRMSLQEADADWHMRTGKALVLGSGGAARAIVYSLLQSELSTIHLANRTREKAEAIAEHFGDKRLSVVDWSAVERHLPSVELLVNTTSLGMQGQPPLALDIHSLPQQALVADIVYKPLHTPLLQQARSQNLKIADGLDMLLYQAQEGFHRWFGVQPEVTPALRHYLLSLLNPPQA